MSFMDILMNNRRETVNSWHIPNDNIHNAKTIFPQSPLSQSRPVLPMADPHFHAVQCAHLAHRKLSICDWSVFKKKHPPQKLQLQWGKKQTKKNWVALTSCLLSLRFTVRRRAEEWVEINVLLLIVKDHLLRPTGNWLEWFTPVSNSLRSSRWTQCFPDSRCGTHHAAAVFWLAHHGWKVCPLRPSPLPDRLLTRHFLLLLYVIENMTSHQRSDENHIVNHANRNMAENGSSMTWQCLMSFNLLLLPE